MIKVEKQYSLPSKNPPRTLLCFDTTIPRRAFSKLVIDGQEYKPIIAFHMDDAYAVDADGDFVGKEVEFK